MVETEPNLNINLEKTDFELPIKNVGNQSSVFSDGGCGDQIRAQSLEVDFTPDDKDEYTRSKCCDFWEAVSECGEMQKFKVVPEKQSKVKSRASSNLSKPFIADVLSPAKQRTALSMLELVEKKGLITRVFEAKIPQTSCPISDREYVDQTTIMELKHNFKPKKIISKSSHKLQNRSSKAHALDGNRTDDDYEVAKLTSTMIDWDAKHPKSMKPPSHSPALSHCVMQR